MMQRSVHQLILLLHSESKCIYRIYCVYCKYWSEMEWIFMRFQVNLFTVHCSVGQISILCCILLVVYGFLKCSCVQAFLNSKMKWSERSEKWKCSNAKPFPLFSCRYTFCCFSSESVTLSSYYTHICFFFLWHVLSTLHIAKCTYEKNGYTF